MLVSTDRYVHAFYGGLVTHPTLIELHNLFEAQIVRTVIRVRLVL